MAKMAHLVFHVSSFRVYIPLFLTYLSVIKELTSPDSRQGRVRLIIDDVVRADRRQRGACHAERASLQFHYILLEDNLIASRDVAAQAVLVKPISYVLLNLIDRITKLL